MPVIYEASLFWVKVDPERPDRYQGAKNASAKWTVQIRTRDRLEADRWRKDYGMKVTPEEDESGLFWKTSLSRFAYRADSEGNEDPNNPNTPVTVVNGHMEKLDPNTIGNGSVGNVSFSLKDDKSGRTLKGIQVTQLKVFEKKDEPDFEATDFEII